MAVMALNIRRDCKKKERAHRFGLWGTILVGFWRRACGLARVFSGLAAVTAVAVLSAGLLPARAEFEIPEVDAEKGAFEAEYRGARHWGVPEGEEADDDDLLRQSHEVELQYGLTDWWMLRLTPNVEQPEGESLELVSIGIETQFVLVPRHGGPLGIAIMAGYGPDSLFVSDPDEVEFGPVVEIAPGPWLFSLNPRLFREVGSAAEQDGFGFEYAAQARLSVTDRWALAVLGFGEIEELAHAGPFETQNHVFGPSLYVFSAPQAEREWALGAGVLFGLTEATADAALRITFAVEY